jgi:hypothetical protein
MSVIGGAQKDIDLALEQPATGERAFVQVKSRADRAVLRDYIERFNADATFQRMFFVCHSPIGDLHVPTDDRRVQLWTGSLLAEMVVRTGLIDWLMRKLK